MSHYLYQLPDFVLFLLLSVFFIIFSIFAVLVIRRYIPLSIRYQDNPVIGNISQLISIIFGVLAGLTALYLINNISYTAAAVQQEVNAVADIYRESKWLPDPARASVQNGLKLYLNEVITKDWPLMKSGIHTHNESSFIIDGIANNLNYLSKSDPSQSLLIRDLFSEIKKLYDARENRIHMSFHTLNPAIWIVILIGTILTITINYFFGMNFYLHIFSVSAVGLMAASMIYLIITLDRPFQGEFAIEPIAFEGLLKYIENDMKSPQVSLKTIDYAG